jgi:hypothetical protein
MTTPNQKTWKDRLPACFGVVDLKFARHPLDAGRAKDMICEARDSGITSEGIISAIRDYLVSKKATQEHIDEEIKYATKIVA